MTSPSPDQVSESIRRLARDRFDEAAWRPLFEVLWPYAVAVCSRLHGGDVAAAEESAHQALIRVARYAPFENLRELSALQAYLRAVCRRVVRSHYAKAASVPSVQIEDAALIASDAYDPEEQAGATILFEAILKDLDHADRELLRMVTAGLSLEEIAHRLGIRYSAAAVRVHRLRNRVSKWLQHM